MPQPNNSSYFECPHCGQQVQQSAKVCRNCGASDEYLWGDAEISDHGDDDFDYDDYVKREFGTDPDGAPAVNYKAFIVLAVVFAMLLPLLWRLMSA